VCQFAAGDPVLVTVAGLRLVEVKLVLRAHGWGGFPGLQTRDGAEANTARTFSAVPARTSMGFLWSTRAR
jgi:hypothetical protein